MSVISLEMRNFEINKGVGWVSPDSLDLTNSGVLRYSDVIVWIYPQCFNLGGIVHTGTPLLESGRNPQPPYLFPISRPILLGGDPLNPPLK